MMKLTESKEPRELVAELVLCLHNLYLAPDSKGFRKMLDKKELEIISLLQAGREAAEEVEKYINSFKHYHVNNQIDDSCKKCGLDLRDRIHAIAI